ncbi:MAG: ribosomal RNA small subunit methyltransferase A [Clostridia bacterium]|nr:ribosomal RNA small subunit methyltransferase A [Clostridia bacterium]
MSKTKSRIRESNLRYRHSLGQHFLYDEEILEALVRETGVTKADDVLEIGPGCGSLTGPLCRAAGRVLAVELDERLIPLLRGFLADYDNVTLLQGDIMSLDPVKLTEDLRKPFTVAANIPYYITTPLIQRLLSPALAVGTLGLMVQKEVAEKILSSPGEEGWGPLAVRCRYRFKPRMALAVPAERFTPPPKVDSAFVVMKRRAEAAVSVRDERMFFKVVGAAFALRRKTMLNNLCATFRTERGEALSWLEQAGLDEKTRGERMSMAELAALADVMADVMADGSGSPDRGASGGPDRGASDGLEEDRTER